MTATSPIHIALLGLGHVAGYQLGALTGLPELFQFTGACDIDPGTENKIPPVAFFSDDPDKFLSEIEAELVLISAPTPLHYSLARQTLAAGHGVVLEKPAASNPEEMEALLSFASKEGRFLEVALHAAVAPEVTAFREQMTKGGLEPGSIRSVFCEFFDPYFTDGKLLAGAKSLGGSWFDSGINALSVLGRFLDAERIRITDAHHTSLPGVDCDDVQALVTAEYDLPGGRSVFPIQIATHWGLGLNLKRTTIHTDDDVITLNHSAQSVISRNGTCGFPSVLETANDQPRLVRHYHHVFLELAASFRESRGNFASTLPIHRLLFDAKERMNRRMG